MIELCFNFVVEVNEELFIVAFFSHASSTHCCHVFFDESFVHSLGATLATGAIGAASPVYIARVVTTSLSSSLSSPTGYTLNKLATLAAKLDEEELAIAACALLAGGVKLLATGVRLQSF